MHIKTLRGWLKPLRRGSVKATNHNSKSQEGIEGALEALKKTNSDRRQPKDLPRPTYHNVEPELSGALAWPGVPQIHVAASEVGTEDSGMQAGMWAEMDHVDIAAQTTSSIFTPCQQDITKGWKAVSTPLHAAAEQGQLETVATLLRHNADVNAKGWKDWTPLHCAAQAGSTAVVLLLLQHGADPESIIEGGRRAVDLARKQGHHECVEVLLASMRAERRQKSLDTSHTAVHLSTPEADAGASSPGVAARPQSACAQHLEANEGDYRDPPLHLNMQVGVQFGDDQRYLVQQLHFKDPDNTFSVASVLDTFDGVEYAAKFYASTSPYVAELKFFQFWKSIPSSSGQRGSVQRMWPVMHDSFAAGECDRLQASVIVMEKGTTSLEKQIHLMKRHQQGPGTAQAAEFVHAIKDVARGLHVMHQHGWVHRDVSPANVLFFSRTSSWKLINFHTAVRTGAQLPVYYSLQFGAPEVVQAEFAGKHRAATASSDMWSVGMIMLHALACDAPRMPNSTSTLWLQMLLGLKRFPFEQDLHFFESVLPSFAVDIVRRLLQRDPSQRPTAKELFEANSTCQEVAAEGVVSTDTCTAPQDTSTVPGDASPATG